MKNLVDYIIKEKIFDELFCDYVISEIKDVEWKFHTWSNHYKILPNTDTKEELEVAYIKNHFQQCFIKKCILDLVNQKLSESRVFSINHTRINKYRTGSSMKKHVDHIYSLFDGEKRGIPILSSIIALNDESDYEGGDFIFSNLNTSVRLKKGEILIFPSLFIYEHYVTTIKKGIRYTAVNWLF